jgi:hypothetical protein
MPLLFFSTVRKLCAVETVTILLNFIKIIGMSIKKAEFENIEDELSFALQTISLYIHELAKVKKELERVNRNSISKIYQLKYLDLQLKNETLMIILLQRMNFLN